MSTEQRVKLANRWHRQIPVSEIQSGDFVEINDRGRRLRRVDSITRRGRIKTRPLKWKGIRVYGAQSFDPAKVVTAWTKRKP